MTYLEQLEAFVRTVQDGTHDGEAHLQGMAEKLLEGKPEPATELSETIVDSVGETLGVDTAGNVVETGQFEAAVLAVNAFVENYAQERERFFRKQWDNQGRPTQGNPGTFEEWLARKKTSGCPSLPFPERFLGPLADWLMYAFQDVDYQWALLTKGEQEVWGDALTFRMFIEWVEQQSALPPSEELRRQRLFEETDPDDLFARTDALLAKHEGSAPTDTGNPS